jgi:hypothetical protein
VRLRTGIDPPERCGAPPSGRVRQRVRCAGKARTGASPRKTTRYEAPSGAERRRRADFSTAKVADRSPVDDSDRGHRPGLTVLNLNDRRVRCHRRTCGTAKMGERMRALAGRPRQVAHLFRTPGP